MEYDGVDTEEQEKIQAIQRFLEGDHPVDIYRNINRSKKWFYKWLNRYHTGNADWYKNLSKRPHIICKKNEKNPAITNLVSNVISFTDGGRVDIITEQK